jgi:pyridoxamine 5'-phosphate oxidase
MTNNQSNLAAVRRQYGALGLDEKDLHVSPIVQAQAWLKQAVDVETADPTAMVLSTVDEQARPDARVVLLKEIQEKGFVFFTHYDSLKGKQIKQNPWVALTFYWPGLVRQLRIRGSIALLSPNESDVYFASRPYLSQLSASVSLQSQPIPDRACLESAVEQLKSQYPEGKVPRPPDWGGYLVTPHEVEFWQGRDNRLHDRILYRLQDGQWQKMRLAP